MALKKQGEKMIDDLFLVVYLPILVVLLGAIYNIFDKRNVDCKHEWGTWEREKDTEFAVVQARICKKCQMHQIHQTRKLCHE